MAAGRKKTGAEIGYVVVGNAILSSGSNASNARPPELLVSGVYLTLQQQLLHLNGHFLLTLGRGLYGTCWHQGQAVEAVAPGAVDEKRRSEKKRKEGTGVVPAKLLLTVVLVTKRKEAKGVAQGVEIARGTAVPEAVDLDLRTVVPRAVTAKWKGMLALQALTLLLLRPLC